MWKDLFYSNQLILLISNTNGNAVVYGRFPVGIREDAVEVIMVMSSPFFLIAVAQFAVLNHRLSIYCISAGYVQGYRSKEANIPTFGTMAASFSPWQSQ